MEIFPEKEISSWATPVPKKLSKVARIVAAISISPWEYSSFIFELKLGHMLYSTTFNYLEKVAAHIYPSKINVDVNSENYDYKSRHENIHHLYSPR